MADIIVEVWDCNDVRLPSNLEMNREMPDPGFITSLENFGQLNPIIVAHEGAASGIYTLVAGRARLMGIRDIAARHGDSDVFVRIVDGLSKDDQAGITLIENAQRAVNPVADFLALKSLLVQGATYSTVSKRIGMSISYVRKLDQDFAGMPDWALQAIKDEGMTVTTAKALNKLSDKAKNECRLEMQDSPKHKLTMSMVQAKHRLIQDTATAQMISLPGTGDLRRVFTRDELEYVLVLIKSDIAKATEYVTGLLQEVE